jgi:hypothetical protein
MCLESTSNRALAVLTVPGPLNKTHRWIGPLDTLLNEDDDTSRIIINVPLSSEYGLTMNIAFEQQTFPLVIHNCETEYATPVHLFTPAITPSNILVQRLVERLEKNQLWHQVPDIFEPEPGYGFVAQRPRSL